MLKNEGAPDLITGIIMGVVVVDVVVDVGKTLENEEKFMSVKYNHRGCVSIQGLQTLEGFI